MLNCKLQIENAKITSARRIKQIKKQNEAKIKTLKESVNKM